MDTLPAPNEGGSLPQEKYRSIRWGPFATLAWGVAMALTAMVSQTLGVAGFLRWWRFAHPDRPIAFASIASHGGVLAFAIVASTLPLLGLIVYAVHLSRQDLRGYLALKWPRWREIGLGVAMLAALLLAVGVLADTAGQETPEFMTDTYSTARDAGMVPLLLIGFVLLAPLQEEALFRGFFFRGFAQAMGAWPAIVITAGTWALIHVQYAWFFVAEIFALGLVLGWLRARSNSTILTFVLHAMINGAALIEAALSAKS